ncbi:manganese catalase family protein [Achromobacter sp. Root565]|uniref:manganese catalase family protein n=1 Tax=Achromobacter sp. Root565 TaxID=1736564 RepID=UPI000A5A4141|nr:manganese catalase family protein [Achromobacter sp. Root565]
MIVRSEPHIENGDNRHPGKRLDPPAAPPDPDDAVAPVPDRRGAVADLYGGGPALVNSGGQLWNAGYIDTIGDPSADLRSNIAAEARAKIIYERLINATDDPGVKDALGFLMTREVSHQRSFEKALYSIEPNFPPGKLPGDPRFASVYFNMSQGEGDTRGPWNSDTNFTYVSDPEQQGSIDGDGMPNVNLTEDEVLALQAMAGRTASDPSSDPVTGTELGQVNSPDDPKP